MKNIIIFVVGVVCGAMISFGTLFATGHMGTNLKNVTYTVETTQFDGFSFR